MSLSDLGADRARRSMLSVALEATVADPPLTDDGYLSVRVDAQPGYLRECPWPTTGDPQPGDAALVMESDHGNLWCIGWWPNG